MRAHLRFAGLPAEEQRAALIEIIRAQSHLMRILEGMVRLRLPDPLLASGAIYNTVWNVLTGRPPLTGIKDADVAYFEGNDLSYEAEDAVIRRAAQEFANSPVPVEVRNQARVHLWFPQKFGSHYPQLHCSADMMRYFASRTHSVAVRLEADGSMSVHAPFGLDDMFAFRVTPNPAIENRKTHTEKGERARRTWPEIDVVSWPD